MGFIIQGKKNGYTKIIAASVKYKLVELQLCFLTLFQ